MRARWYWLFLGGVIVLPALTYLAWSWRMEDLFVEEAARIRAVTPPVPEADEGPMPPLLRRAATLFDRPSLPRVVRDAVPGAKWTQADRDEVAAYLLAHAPCLDTLDQACEAGRGRFGVSWWNQTDLHEIGWLVQLLHARAIRAGLAGDAEAARRDVKAAFTVANVLPPDSLSLFNMYGSVMGMNLKRLTDIAGLPGFDAAATRRELEPVLAALGPRERLRAAWRGQRLGLVRWFDTVRRDHGAIEHYSIAGEHWRKWSIARPLLFGDAATSIQFWSDALRYLENGDRAGLESLRARDDGLPEFVAPHSLSGFPVMQYRRAVELEDAVRRARAMLEALENRERERSAEARK